MKLFLLASLLGVASSIPTNMTLKLLDDKEAVCDQGQQAGYYYYNSNDPQHVNDFMIIVSNNQEGELWCLPPGKVNKTKNFGNCYWASSADNATVPSIPTVAQIPGDGSGIFSANCTSNPDFCKFNKILIQSCDGANFMGNTDVHLEGRTIKFRGQRILSSSIEQIAKDYKFSSKTKVLMSGFGGGAFLLYQQADRLGEKLNTLSGVTDYSVLVVDGYWPRWSGYHSGDTFAQWIGGDTSSAPQPSPRPDIGIFDYANCSGSVNQDCLKEVNDPSKKWECALPTQGLTRIKSRIFAVEQAWGAFGSFCLVNAVFDYDVNWHGWHVSCDPRDGVLHTCVEYGWTCTPQYLDAFVNPYINNTNVEFKGSGAFSKPGNGGFLHSCHIGVEDASTDYWRQIAIDGVTMQQAVSKWWHGTKTDPGTLHEPCLWAPNYTKPFKNCCNPSCPNIPYNAKKTF